MDINLLSQILQYILEFLPDHVVADIMVIITFVVTLCTFILRFWREPVGDKKWHRVWEIIYLLASLKLPTKSSMKKAEIGIITGAEKGMISDEKR